MIGSIIFELIYLWLQWHWLVNFTILSLILWLWSWFNFSIQKIILCFKEYIVIKMRNQNQKMLFFWGLVLSSKIMFGETWSKTKGYKFSNSYRSRKSLMKELNTILCGDDLKWIQNEVSLLDHNITLKNHVSIVYP